MADKNRWEGFKLLREEAMTSDAFKHHTHEAVADSLAQIIIQEDGGATVGIEGTWGGGKSTVINILRAKLKGKAFFFIFDAWAHEEDCLRRVFLESLLSCIIKAIKARYVEGDEEYFSRLEERVDGRLKTTRVRTTRHPTAMGVLSIIFGFLSALGMGLWQMGVHEGSVANEMYYLLGLYLSLSPLFALLLWILFHPSRILEVFTSKFWTFLDSNSYEDTTQDVSDDNERSSVEFERFFSDIMTRVSEQNSNKKIVIAVDNLDRIDGAKSLALWSTLQTFLQKRSGGEQEDWFRKLWVLVPYDAEGLERVWTISDSAKDNDTATAKSFLDKAFQVRVEVPRPVMADWQAFAKDRIAELFTNEHPKDLEDVLRILEVTRNGLSNIPTPREIKNYVNQVAVFRNQFCENVDTKTIAYYVIKRFLDDPRFSTDSIRQKLLDKSFPEKKDRPYLPHDVEEQLCGIIFGVSPKDGRQLLLEPEIADALENDKCDVLKRTMDEHGDGAWMAFDSYVRRVGLWKDVSDIRKFLTAVSCVAKCNYDEYRLRTFADICRDYLSRLCRAEPGKLKAFFDSDDGQLDIAVSAIEELTRLLGKKLLCSLNKALTRTLEVIVAEDEIDKSQVGKVSSRLFMAFEEESRNNSVVKTFTAEKLRQFCSTLPKRQYELSQWIVPPDSIVADVVTAIRQDSRIPPYLGRVVKYVIESGIKVDWTVAIDSVKKHILFNNGHTAEDIPTRRALDILLFIIGACNAKYIGHIKPLLVAGQFYNFVSVKPEERARKAALLLACCDPELCSNIHPASQVGNSQVGIDSINAVLTSESDDDAKAVLELIDEFSVESSLREFKHDTPSKIFGTMIRYSMQSTEYSWFNYDEDDPLDSIWLYAEHLNVSKAVDKEEKLATYMDYLNSKFGVVSILNKKGFANEDFKFCSKLIKYYLSKDFATLKGTVIAHLSKLPEDDYYSNLNDADFVDLLVFLVEHDCHEFLGLEYLKGLSRLLVGKGEEAKKRNEFISGITQNSINALTRAIKPEYKGKLSKTVVGALKTIEEADPDKVKSYYDKVSGICYIEDFSGEIVDDMAWKGASDGKFDLLVIAAELIERNRQSDKAWLPSVDAKASMVEPLQKIFQSTTDSAARDTITRVAQYYDVQLTPLEEERSDDSDDSPAGE